MEIAWLAYHTLCRACALFTYNSFAFHRLPFAIKHMTYIHSTLINGQTSSFIKCSYCLQWKLRLMHLGFYTGHPFQNWLVLGTQTIFHRHTLIPIMNIISTDISFFLTIAMFSKFEHILCVSTLSWSQCQFYEKKKKIWRNSVHLYNSATMMWSYSHRK